MAAEAGVPGPAGGRAGLLARQTQRDATTVNCLQVAWTGWWRLQTGVFFQAAETKIEKNALDSHEVKENFIGYPLTSLNKG